MASKLSIKPSSTFLSQRVQYEENLKVAKQKHVSNADIEEHYSARTGQRDIGFEDTKFKYEYQNTSYTKARKIFAKPVTAKSQNGM